jgi:hypothetical protein
MSEQDPELVEGGRSERTLSSDRLQEQLAFQRQTVFGFSFLLVVVAEAAMWFFGIPVWIRIVTPIMWLGFLIHNNALLILHELWEVNDQISGRKDEFRNVLRKSK